MSKTRNRSAQPMRIVSNDAHLDDLLSLYQMVRQATEKLVAPLSAEDCALQSMPDASPAKWHLAHTSWFFETFILGNYLPRYKAFNAHFRILFNSYYNAIGEKHPRQERGMISRPSLDEVYAYRHHVDTHIALLADANKEATAPLCDLLTLGINHEEQHQELILTDFKHLLSCNPLKPAYQKQWPLTTVRARKPRWSCFAAGVYEIGHAGNEFAFDNEGPRHSVYLNAFEIASHPVTHGDFLAFINDGGYQRPELWLSVGWDAVQSRHWQAPQYWEKYEGKWRTFTLHGMAPIDTNTPVCHVSYFEADAFARWAGARLPTEAQWEVAAAAVPIKGNFLDSGALHPLAMRDEPPPPGLAQMFGDTWEWTQSAYSPYPGFAPAAGAIGEYNGKFMCNQYVLRGGSCVTPQRHVRPSYRNFFPPDTRWQFSGLRLAKDC